MIIFIVKDNAFCWWKVLELRYPDLHPMDSSTDFLIFRSRTGKLGEKSFDEEPVETALGESSRTLPVLRKEG